MRLIPIHDDGFKEINIFIHGYNIKNRNNYKKLIRKINQLELRGQVYLLYWKSTEDGIFPFDYLNMKDKAKNVGVSTLKLISKIENSMEYPINLIGYSLGTVVIQYALYWNFWRAYNLNNVILLGGVASNENNYWEVCLREVNGKIYNVYSKEDDKLRYEVTETTIGRNPIETKNKKIKNKKLVLEHDQYMNNLDYIFDIIIPERKRSKKYFGEIEYECPDCEENLIIVSNVWGNCPFCGMKFSYSPSRQGHYS